MKQEKGKPWGVWRSRGRRFVMGANVGVALLLSIMIVLMLNVFSFRHYVRWDVSTRGFYRLSERTTRFLRDLDFDVRVVAIIRRSHSLYPELQHLLEQYRYEAGKAENGSLSVEFIDPDRDLARTREASATYDLPEGGAVVFECGESRRIVSASDFNEVEVDTSRLLETGVARKKRVGFRGEQLCSSALLSVTRSARPRVLFLAGHGERSIEDFSETAGYSGIARIMRRDNIELETFSLTEANRIPDRCTVLVVAGPKRRLARAELDAVSDFLERSGRVLFLLDASVASGLEDLLLDWGVQLRDDVVVDPAQTWTGRELCVLPYSGHPITEPMQRLAVMFYMPRSVQAVEGVGQTPLQADKPRVSALAGCSEAGWAEFNLNQSPAQFDEGLDQPGPVPVAVAVERGPVSEIDVELRPTRLVVIGDSDFVSNGALRGSFGGNVDMFLCALNWLAERESLLGIAPKRPHRIKLDMTRGRLRNTFALMVVVIPGAFAVLGALAAFMRRR